MRANPGGSLDTKDVLGRDGLIQLIWDTLEIKSVRLEAERRIGKTSIIRKMRDEPHGGWSPIYMELERIHSAEELAEAVSTEVDALLSRWTDPSRIDGPGPVPLLAENLAGGWRPLPRIGTPVTLIRNRPSVSACQGRARTIRSLATRTQDPSRSIRITRSGRDVKSHISQKPNAGAGRDP